MVLKKIAKLSWGLQIGVSKKYQGKRFSKIIIGNAKRIQRRYIYQNFVIPIRPTLKSKYPLIPIEKYITWKHTSA
jgi:hypothetical protein